MSVRPVCSSYMAGAWIVLLHQHDLRKAMSSTQVLRWGIRSDTHWPLFPCRLNVRVLGRTVSVPWVNWLTGLSIESGRGLPAHLARSGLGSNRSTGLGPPTMNRKMTRLAVGAKSGSFGANGERGGSPPWDVPCDFPSRARSPARAAAARKSRRWWVGVFIQ